MLASFSVVLIRGPFFFGLCLFFFFCLFCSSLRGGGVAGRKAGRKEGRKERRNEGRKAGRKEGRKGEGSKDKKEGRKAGRQEGRKERRTKKEGTRGDGRKEGRKNAGRKEDNMKNQKNTNSKARVIAIRLIYYYNISNTVFEATRWPSPAQSVKKCFCQDPSFFCW